MNPAEAPSFDKAFPRFARIGVFTNGQFSLDKHWRGRKGVYVWAHRDHHGPVPRRVGIACGMAGISGRHNLHNRWLAGLFKPHDQREQAVRRFTLEGLGQHAELWAIEIPDRLEAAAFEESFRARHATTLTIDLSVRTGWIKQRMTDWRANAATEGAY